MKIMNDNVTLENFNTWGGAIETKDTILAYGKGDEFEQLVEELYPDGLTDRALNDLLWFEDEWLFENLGIKKEM